MSNKTPSEEEISRKKELVYHYKTRIFKLFRKAKAYQYQIDKIQAQIKDYEKEKDKLEKWLKEN